MNKVFSKKDIKLVNQLKNYIDKHEDLYNFSITNAFIFYNYDQKEFTNQGDENGIWLEARTPFNDVNKLKNMSRYNSIEIFYNVKGSVLDSEIEEFNECIKYCKSKKEAILFTDMNVELDYDIDNEVNHDELDYFQGFKKIFKNYKFEIINMG